MKSRALMVLLLVLAGLAQAQEWRDIRDDVDRSVPPTVRWYLEQRAENARLRELGQPVTLNRMPDSLNVRLVGKWGRGPANRVTGRDSLVFMSLGSEVAVFNCADASHPTIISEIQCRNITGRLVLKDSFLFVGANGPVEIYNIANLANPRLVCYAPVSGGELAIEDSLCYVLGVDSLYIYNVTNPASFQRLGACRDSGYNMCASDGFVYLCDRWGLYVIDATNPASPHRVGTMSGGIQVGAAWVESGYCYYTEVYPSAALVVANVSDPHHPSEVGRRAGSGGGEIFKLSFFVYLPWSPGYQIIDVSQPGNPTLISSLSIPGSQNSFWTRNPYGHGFVADEWEGLAVIDISDPVHPVLDTLVAGADEAYDVYASGNLAYVADYLAGVKILDVTNPAGPNQTGDYDTTDSEAGINGARARAVRIRDTLAYVATNYWTPANLRVVDVATPASPRLLGGCLSWNPPATLEVRDSLAYVAENYKLEIFSIANPRSPRLVGSCQLVNSPWDVCLIDTIAYVTTYPPQIVNVKDSAHPFVVGSINNGDAYGICFRDTILLVGGWGKLDAVSIANPAEPYVISSFPLPDEICYGIAIDGALAYVGTAATPTTSKLRVFDVSNPSAMRSIGHYVAPASVLRVRWQEGLIYAACYNAGVCIFETKSTVGVAEREPGQNRRRTPKLDFWPNPAGNTASLRLTGETVLASKSGLFDMSGRLVKDINIPVGRNNQVLQLDLTDLEPGIYFAVWQNKTGKATAKVVKR